MKSNDRKEFRGQGQGWGPPPAFFPVFDLLCNENVTAHTVHTCIMHTHAQSAGHTQTPHVSSVSSAKLGPALLRR